MTYISLAQDSGCEAWRADSMEHQAGPEEQRSNGEVWSGPWAGLERCASPGRVRLQALARLFKPRELQLRGAPRTPRPLRRRAPRGRQGFPPSPARRSLRVDCALTPQHRSPMRSQALLRPGAEHHSDALGSVPQESAASIKQQCDRANGATHPLAGATCWRPRILPLADCGKC